MLTCGLFFVGVWLSLYFGYHAIKGRHGLEARLRLAAKAEALEQRLAGLETDRARLERRISLLQDDHLDLDLLDETARAALGFVRPGEIVLAD